MQASLAVGTEAEEPNAESDEALALRGDTESFIFLYRKYLPPVYRYLYARLGNREEAEDMTAVVFERALTSIKSYKPSGSFASWLFTIAHRALADHYRRRQTSANYVPIDAQAETLFDPVDSPEEQAMFSERLGQVLQIIAQLTREQQEVISLRFMAGLRYVEIATIMKKREAAVKMIAYRALEQIRQRYGDVN